MSITRAQFAYALMDALEIAPNANSVAAIVAWETGENTGALNNPLATERVLNVGETDFNVQGVKNYPSFELGIKATVETLQNGLYGPILFALAQGAYYGTVNAIVASP